WWTIMLGFSLQILFDFAGYSLIARGLGKLMGYHFTINFNHPYLSVSLKEFWERWHISLSTWFRDYVYIPLGGSRKGKFKGHVNMWITMIVSGIWHGASFNFIIWGGIHAGMLSLERITRWPKKLAHTAVLRFFSWFLVGLQVMIAWVFFRAENLPQAIAVLKNMFVWSGASYSINFINQFNNSIIFIFIGILYELIYLLMLKIKTLGQFMKISIVEALLYALLLLFCIFFRGPESEFIYFQF
ncbi:MAG: MBOAT family O-acyltransferase, partial [Cytophaga sp.]|uniref:MBOAT family O-acyltransferase n=1 Tax=Cytophaga sp. TaxID=29535 RepID=UPI003F7DE99F